MHEPTEEAILSAADAAGLPSDEETAAALADKFAQQDAILEALDTFDGPDADKWTHRDYWDPDPDGDPLGAYLTRCDVGGGAGPLDGLTVTVKDNIAVAGVPMTCGSPLLSEFVPREDATVVDRLLDQGARVVGKANMDEFAFGGDESTMRLRLARNPHDTDRQPGSSSAGAGIAVATGQADVAIGSDTGGSIRFPAAWCGVVGVKPTRGLVSHHGFVQFAKTLDNVGVLAGDTATVADALTAIAGEDLHDERTRGARVGDYGAAVNRGRDADPDGLTIGLPEELFGNAPEHDDIVRDALTELEAAGATLQEISIPTYDLWLPAWLAIGMTEVGHYLRDRTVNTWSLHPGDPRLAAALGEALDEREDELGGPLLSAWLYAHHLVHDDDNRRYAQAQRARRRLVDGVDEALADVDVLASTTVPLLPPEWGEGIDDVFGALANTAPFNVSGHPAVSVPAGAINGLPVGLQFVAPRFAEAAALRAAAHWEAIRTD